MTFIPSFYLTVLKRKDFFILILTFFLGQIASAFLLLSLISSVFSQTSSNFGVSGVILSLSAPAFFLMAFAGLAADLIDRKKIIVSANFIISVIVFLILLSLENVYLSISLSFLYFAGNSFFLPAVSAASAQLVKKSQLLVANSIFIFTLSGGQIIGLFVAAIIHFFFGNVVTLVICEVLLIMAVFLPMFLPPLAPLGRQNPSIVRRVKSIISAFTYILRSPVIWFFFVTFASIQGIVAFGATLGPGFFDEVVGLSIAKSPIIILPSVAFGLLLGALYIHNPKMDESFFVKVGIGAIGLASALFGLIIKLGPLKGILLILPASVFLIIAGFGAIITMIASRTVLQKKVAHNFQGTVFGANIILAAFISSVFSPLSAILEAFLGYINILIYVGILFLIISLTVGYFNKRWKFSI